MAAYTFEQVRGLVTGRRLVRFTSLEREPGALRSRTVEKRAWVESLSWAQVRSEVERSGHVDQEAWCLVMDLERAVDRLASEHPEGAMAIVLAAWGFEPAVIARRLGGGSVLRRSMGWVVAWLNGAEDEELKRVWEEGR